MKQLIFALVATFSLTINAQGIMVVNEIETDSPENFKTMVTQWMTAIKTGMELESLNTHVFAELGTKKMQFLQWYDSKQAMIDRMDQQENSREKIWAALQEMPPLPEGALETFNEVTSFRESSVWEYMPELSTTPETWTPLSQEEKDEHLYRRVQFVSVNMNADNAYENWTKKINEIDKKLGITYHYAVFKSMFGARDADYMVVLVDKSRFEYHANWEKRMELRLQDEDFNAEAAKATLDQWAVIDEFNWDRIIELTF